MSKDSPSMEGKEILCLIYSNKAYEKHSNDSSFIKKILGEFVEQRFAYDTYKKDFGIISPFIFKNFLQICIKDNLKKYKYKLIKFLYQRIFKSTNNKPSFPQNLEYRIQNGRLVIDYEILSYIVEYLLFFLSQAISQEKEINRLFEEQKLYKECSCKVQNKELTIDFFLKVSHIEMKIGDLTKYEQIDLDRILFFSIFYQLLFSNTQNVTIDLNITKLNSLYQTNNSPYKMQQNNIEASVKSFSNCFIAQYLILNTVCSTIKKQHFQLRMFDSYLIEMESVLFPQCDHIPGFKREMIDTMIFANIYPLNKLFFLECYFNALDNSLFRRYLYLLFHNEELNGFSIRLFPKTFNKRKMLLNNYYFDKKDIEAIDSKYKHYDILHRNKYDWMHKDKNVIKDEYVNDFLFDDFNLNLSRLTVVIQKRCKVSQMKIDCKLPEELRSLQNYSYAIGIFIYNLFLAVQLKNVQIRFKCLEIIANVDLPDAFFLKLPDKINLGNLHINKIILDIKNVSKYILLDELPTINLNSLTMNSLNYNDLCQLAHGIQKKKYNLESLKEIAIEVAYTKEEEYDGPLKLLFHSLPDNLVKFSYKMKTYTTDALIINSVNYLIELDQVETKVNADLCFFVPELDLSESELNSKVFVHRIKQKIWKEATPKQSMFYKIFFSEMEYRTLTITVLKYSQGIHFKEQYDLLNNIINNLNSSNSNVMMSIYSILGFLNCAYQRLTIKLFFNK